MTEFTHLVEERRLQLTESRDSWYIHLNNAAGYTEVYKDGYLTTTFHDKTKKQIVEKVSES
jgi:hypothetical protein